MASFPNKASRAASMPHGTKVVMCSMLMLQSLNDAVMKSGGTQLNPGDLAEMTVVELFEVLSTNRIRFTCVEEDFE